MTNQIRFNSISLHMNSLVEETVVRLSGILEVTENDDHGYDYYDYCFTARLSCGSLYLFFLLFIYSYRVFYFSVIEIEELNIYQRGRTLFDKTLQKMLEEDKGIDRSLRFFLF